MQELQRQQVGHPGRRGGTNVWDDAATATVDTAATATVMHGPYAEQIPVADMAVGMIRQRYGDRFDISPDSVAFIDGNPVDEHTTVRAGQVLMFARRAGEKGGGETVTGVAWGALP
ncbi:MAG: hypothetical protein PVF43_06980 [Candidatus Eiseniibacteriota bacterium]|jgi:hypothetical protein